jgi:hypothetical protein
VREEAADGDDGISCQNEGGRRVAHLNQLEGTLLDQLEGFRTLLTSTNREAGGENISWKAHFKPKTLK